MNAVALEEDLRDRIVRTALALFQDKGYRATSLGDIIAAANCSTGGFYHHFSSKDDLLFLIHEQFISEALARCKAIHDRKDSATSRLTDVIVDIVQNVGNWKEHVTVFFEERRFMSTDRFSIVLDKRRAYDQMVRDIVEEGMRNGEFADDIPPIIATLGIYGMVHWTYQWMRPDGRLTPRQIGEICARRALHGLLAKNKPAGQAALRPATGRKTAATKATGRKAGAPKLH